MYEIFVAKAGGDFSANIEPLKINRDWMDKEQTKHVYHCLPVTQANQLGWSISFPEDISFIWDGQINNDPESVKILSGSNWADSATKQGTINFRTGLIFRTDKNLSLLGMPVPNQFIEGAEPFFSVVSTSFFKGSFPCSWKVTKPNQVITIKANTPVIAILPISLTEMQNSSITYTSFDELDKNQPEIDILEYRQIITEDQSKGKWNDFYRRAMDQNGNIIGEHEVKAIKLTVNE